MSDRASATIIIGGAVPRSIMPALIRAIEQDHGLADWDGAVIDEIAIVSGKPLEVRAFELPGGIFEAVECLCRANNIPFVRCSGSCSGVFGPERVVFDGLAAARHYQLSETKEVVLTRSALIDLGSMAAAKQWFATAGYTPPPVDIVEDAAGPLENRPVDHG